MACRRIHVIQLAPVSPTNIKFSHQCGIAASRGYKIIRLIRRIVAYMKIKKNLYYSCCTKTIVTPNLKTVIQEWRPLHKKDIYMLEKVQRRATKLIQKIRNTSYEMRLRECGF